MDSHSNLEFFSFHIHFAAFLCFYFCCVMSDSNIIMAIFHFKLVHFDINCVFEYLLTFCGCHHVFECNIIIYNFLCVILIIFLLVALSKKLLSSRSIEVEIQKEISTWFRPFFLSIYLFKLIFFLEWILCFFYGWDLPNQMFIQWIGVDIC